MGYMTIRLEMAALSERIKALEKAVGVEPAPRMEVKPVPAAAPRPPVATKVTPEPTMPVVAPPTVAFEPATPPTRPAAPLRPSPASVDEPAPAETNLEWLIGARAFAVVGALGMITGIALFLRYALQQGWFVVTPSMKCIGAGAFGAFLMVVGEIARRRLPSAAASAISAVGLVSMYGAFYAAFARYGLLTSPEITFSCLIGVSVVGVIAAAISRSTLLAILGQLGAYMIPLLVPDPSAPVWTLPAYITLLLAASSVLPIWQPTTFRGVRVVAGFGTAIYAFIWLAASNGIAFPIVALVFFGTAWLITHAELISTAHRIDADSRIRTIISTFASLGSTSWVVMFSTLVMLEHWPDMDWAPALVGFFTTVSVASFLAPALGLDSRMPRDERERLSCVLLAQGAALLILMLALLLSDWMLAVSWLGLGVAGIAAARRTGSHALRIYGAILLTFGTVHVLTADFVSAVDKPALIAAPGLHLTTFAVLAAIASGAWIFASTRLAKTVQAWRPELPAMLIGIVLAYCIPLHPDATTAGIMHFWVLISLVVTAVGFLRDQYSLSVVALVGLILSAALWIVAYVVPGWMDSTAAAGLHAGLLSSLFLSGALFALSRLSVRTLDDADEAPGAAVAMTAMVVATLLLFGSTTLEVARAGAMLAPSKTAELGAISLWWAIFGTGLIALGFARRQRAPRYAGLALIGIAGGKVLLVDSVEVEQVWRIVGFFGVGLLMVLVAFAYAMLTKYFDERAPEDGES